MVDGDFLHPPLNVSIRRHQQKNIKVSGISEASFGPIGQTVGDFLHPLLHACVDMPE